MNIEESFSSWKFQCCDAAKSKTHSASKERLTFRCDRVNRLLWRLVPGPTGPKCPQYHGIVALPTRDGDGHNGARIKGGSAGGLASVDRFGTRRAIFSCVIRCLLYT